MSATLVGTPDPDERRQASNTPRSIAVPASSTTAGSLIGAWPVAPIATSAGPSNTVNVIWTRQHQGPA